jgi:hypothetical protein
LIRDVEKWLSKLDPARVAQQNGEPEHTWAEAGLIVHLTAIPRKSEARRARLQAVGNPVPSAAYRSKVVNVTGRPVAGYDP